MLLNTVLSYLSGSTWATPQPENVAEILSSCENIIVAGGWAEIEGQENEAVYKKET